MFWLLISGVIGCGVFAILAVLADTECKHFWRDRSFSRHSLYAGKMCEQCSFPYVLSYLKERFGRV